MSKTRRNYGTHTYRPWMFRSISHTIITWILKGVLESALWKLDRPPPVGFFAPPEEFHCGGCGLSRQPTFCFDGRVFPHYSGLGTANLLRLHPGRVVA